MVGPNYKSQGSMIKHLNCDMLLYYKSITQSAGERIFKIGDDLAKLRTKWLTVSCAHSRLFLKHAELAR